MESQPAQNLWRSSGNQHRSEGLSGGPCTHPLLLILHQHFLQSHLLARLTVLGFKYFPAGTERDPRDPSGISAGTAPPPREEEQRESRHTVGCGPGLPYAVIPHHVFSVLLPASALTLLHGPYSSPGGVRSHSEFLSATLPNPNHGPQAPPRQSARLSRERLWRGLARLGNNQGNRRFRTTSAPALSDPTSALESADPGLPVPCGLILPECALADLGKFLVLGDLIAKRAFH